MSVSTPTKPIYALDVPEVGDLRGEFRYNYHTADESKNDSGVVSKAVLTRKSEGVNAEFLQYATTRVPRFVAFSFSPPQLSTLGRQVSESDVNANVFNVSDYKGLISQNLNKIVTEDEFASGEFTSINFHDSELITKAHALISGSFETLLVNKSSNNNTSMVKAASQIKAVLPPDITATFLQDVASDPEDSYGGTFSVKSGGNQKGLLGLPVKTKSQSSKTQPTVTQAARNEKIKLLSRLKSKLSSVAVNVQVNSKVVADVTKRIITSPVAMNSGNMNKMYSVASPIQQAAKQQFSPNVSATEYKSNVSYVSVKYDSSTTQSPAQPAKIIGFLIDKTEIRVNGTAVQHSPIIIENPKAKYAADFAVKYGSTYVYTIRTVAMLTLPAIDEETNATAQLQLLVTSKPSHPIYVSAVETEPPPPPSDFGFTWDYESGKLLLHWTFPVNPQRDIKKFQVFRRKSVDEPFQLLKMYDFDDSQIKLANNENPAPALVEYLNSPVTFYYDDEFKKTSSKFIYAVACIDAHGFTSTFSAQFEVWFDVFKNKLQRKLISHHGAPKPYPNLYLEAAIMSDTIRVAGSHSKTMKLYLTPEHYAYFNNDNNSIKLVKTTNEGSKYKLQFINTDIQKSTTITISIEDLIYLGAPTASPSSVVPGPSYVISSKT